MLVGCGALGTVIADQLVRAGMGRLIIVDRDIVEITNLQRQVLFDQRDVESGRPKALAAKEKLERINGQVVIEAHVNDFNADNALRLGEGADVLLDGLDNFETRYLLNDLAVQRGLPYVYGGAVGTGGMGMVVLAHATHRRDEAPSHITWTDEQAGPCLRCLFPEPPPAGASATCDTIGVLASVVNIIASWQVLQTIKLATGNLDALDRALVSYDGWSNTWQQFGVQQAWNESCPCCGHGEFHHLEGRSASTTTTLCGRNAVQIRPSQANGRVVPSIDLAALHQRLEQHGEFTRNDALLRGTFAHERNSNGEPIELMLFADGRAILRGVDEPELAKTIYSRYIGD